MAEIRAMISTKSYCKHVIEPYFSIDTQNPDSLDYEQVLDPNKKKCCKNSYYIFRSIN